MIKTAEYIPEIIKGFEGYVKISELRKNIKNVPQKRGVYIIYSDLENVPHFNEKGGYKSRKGKSTTVSIETLNSIWVEKANVIYIGKAGGTGKKATIQSRLKQYMKFGESKTVSHWGGRYIWHIQNYDNLLVAWKTSDKDEPRVVEEKMIKEFEDIYGKIPFANCCH